jgi:hypothetical protein
MSIQLPAFAQPPSQAANDNNQAAGAPTSNVSSAVSPAAPTAPQTTTAAPTAPTAPAPSGTVAPPPTSGAPRPSAANDNAPVAMVFKDGNGELKEIVIPHGSNATLTANSPEALAKQDKTYREGLLNQCGNQAGALKQVLHDFPGEAGAFYAGLAMSARLQIKNDPGAYQHFYEQNITNVMGHVSFAFFMLGSRGTTSILNFTGVNFDLCHEIKKRYGKIDEMDAVTREKAIDEIAHIKPTKIQARMRWAVGPLGMTGGFLMSSMLTEFVSDPNIHLCAKGLVKEIPASEKPARELACAKAYKDWVMGQKIIGYIPDLLSMTLTSAIQAYGVNFIAGKAFQGAKFGARAAGTRALGLLEGQTAKIVLTSLEVVWDVSALAAPLVRFGIQAAGAVVFVTINDHILPYFKFPFEKAIQGRNITSSINLIYEELDRIEKNGWVWAPRAKPIECTYEPTPQDYALGYMPPYYCLSGDTPKIGLIINELNDEFKKWRETVLGEAYSAHSHWKDYLIGFQNNYASSRKFYDALASRIVYKRTPGVTPDASTTRLYSSVPFSGLNFSGIENVCDLSPEQKKLLKDAADLAGAAIEEIKSKKLNAYDPSEQEWLEKIFAGLSAADCSAQALQGAVNPALVAAQSAARGQNGETPSAQQLTDVEKKIKSAQVKSAIDLITKILNENKRLGDHGRSPLDPYYASLTKWNPFARLKLLLGDPKPLPEGEAYILDLENNPQIFDQDLKSQHPSRVLMIQTPSMSDYMLASMVCGPDISTAQAIEDHGYVETKPGIIAQTLGWFGFNFTDVNHLLNSDAMIYLQYHQEAQGLIHLKTGISADFRPPKIVDFGEEQKMLCMNVNAPIGPGAKPKTLHEIAVDVKGQHYVGFLSLIKQFLDPKIAGTDHANYNLSKWWSSAIDPYVLKVVDLFRADFKNIVETQFIPNFIRTDSEKYNKRRFELGISKSIESQANLNLNLLGKAYYPKKHLGQADSSTWAGPANGATAAVDPRFVTTANKFMKHLHLQNRLFGALEDSNKAILEVEKIAMTPDEDARPQGTNVKFTDLRFQEAFDANTKILNDTIDEMAKIGAESKPEVAPEAIAGLKELADAASASLKGLVTETGSYFGIVDTIRFDGLD